jgi:hypothetical protein
VSGLLPVEPVNRASGLAVAVTSPPTMAACQSPGVTATPRHALAFRETVRVNLEFKESFFSRGATRPPPLHREGEIHARHSRMIPAF